MRKLDPDALAAAALDYRDLDLDNADRVTYVLDQSFHYAYDEPIESLRQRLVVIPPQRHGNQHRRAHRVDVTGAAARRVARRDGRGNTVLRLHAARVEESVRFSLCAVVERIRQDGPTVLPAEALRDPRLLRATRLTAADDRLRDLSTGLLGMGDPIDVAERICSAVSTVISYQDGITSVRTTAAEALAEGRGVCQDAAHVMLALCHLAAVPARYVSGHLLGQGGTHAWVEVVVPNGNVAMAVPFDPCNGRRAGFGYVTVATGRDYSDVAPTSGRYVGTPNSTLTTDRRMGVLAAA